jgi:hypothetical protein
MPSSQAKLLLNYIRNVAGVEKLVALVDALPPYLAGPRRGNRAVLVRPEHCRVGQAWNGAFHVVPRCRHPISSLEFVSDFEFRISHSHLGLAIVRRIKVHEHIESIEEEPVVRSLPG